MKTAIYAAALAAIIASALRISPETPEYIPYAAGQDDDLQNNAVRFLGGDGRTMLTGYWSLPTNTSTGENYNPPAVVLLAHGLGLIQGKSLRPFVQAFQSAGYAVVTFDYATFGKSDGVPRQQINPNSHVADIQAAVSMIKQDGVKRGVNVSSIGLWGTSLGGGHVLVAAANADPAVRAVVAQVPHIASGLEAVLGTLLSTPAKTFKGIGMFLLGLIKWGIWQFINQTAYFPIVGEPGSAALMQNPGDNEGYLGVFNPRAEVGSGWTNAATTESGLRLLFYRPLSTVSAVDLPALLIAAENDTLCPAKYVQSAKERIPNAEILMLSSLGHFEVYSGEPLRTMLTAQIDFFKTHLN